MENTQWLIWSIEHDAWWGPDANGYVDLLHLAGTYSYEDALKIVQGANINLTFSSRSGERRSYNTPNEAMILLNDKLKDLVIVNTSNEK